MLEEATGSVSIAKVASRPDNPSEALIDAVQKGLSTAGANANDVTLLVHGMTIITNAVLEEKLPSAALITTKGFQDILEI